MYVTLLLQLFLYAFLFVYVFADKVGLVGTVTCKYTGAIVMHTTNWLLKERVFCVLDGVVLVVKHGNSLTGIGWHSELLGVRGEGWMGVCCVIADVMLSDVFSCGGVTYFSILGTFTEVP